MYSKKFDYEITQDDLKEIFRLANKWLFKNKLNPKLVDIIMIDNAINHKDKGSFKLGLNKDGKHLIGVVKYIKDNFYHVVNVFLHEIIHFYDSQFGPLKNNMDITYVDDIQGKQYVNRYDAHGKFFKDECARLNAYGFDIKEKYNINGKLAMKKILEKNRNTDKFFDNANDNDDKVYARVKAVYDSLENCNKDMVYRDAKHWYIQID